MTDLTARGFKVKSKHKCDMCGKKHARHVIMDPNKFPNNDPDAREDTWDVCPDCKLFVEQGVMDSYALMGLVALAKSGDTKAVEELGKHPNFSRAYKTYKDIGGKKDAT